MNRRHFLASIATLGLLAGCGEVTSDEETARDPACDRFMTQEECEASNCGRFIGATAYCSMDCDVSSALRVVPGPDSKVGICTNAGGYVGDAGVHFHRRCPNGGIEAIEVGGYEWVEGWEGDIGGCTSFVRLDGDD